MNYQLECEFHSLVGSNCYITPPGCQGLAPHYDDIEAFVLQLEGKKRWFVYEPVFELPSEYGTDFPEDHLKKPLLDVVLEAGDLLYFPRGYIHQASAFEDAHSIHITLSTRQNNSWFHYLNFLFNQSLETSFNNNLELRKGLPFDFYSYMGSFNEINQEKEKERDNFKKKCKKIIR
jgi:lysine-specific demethylase/histidyl-hydroxylase NO66